MPPPPPPRRLLRSVHAGEARCQRYVVKGSDTFYTIANDFGVDMTVLEQANPTVGIVLLSGAECPCLLSDSAALPCRAVLP